VTLQACAYSGQIGALCHVKRTSPSVKSGPTRRSKRALTQAKLWPRAASSGLHLWSNQDRRHALGVHLLKPNRGLVPRQADFIFGQIKPTPRSRRALTQAKSWPRAASSGLHLWSNQDRRHAPSVRLLRTNRGLVPRQADFVFGQIRTNATLQACACSGQIGALYRVKQTSSSVTMISDRLGSGALNAVRAHAVTYPAEGHLEDYAPLRGGGIASTALRKHAQKGKNFGHEGFGGTLTYITCQKQGTKGRLVKNLTLRGSGGEPRSLPREEKSTSPTT
jgi:hypothetical protein